MAKDGRRLGRHGAGRIVRTTARNAGITKRVRRAGRCFLSRPLGCLLAYAFCGWGWVIPGGPGPCAARTVTARRPDEAGFQAGC
jgi:hypothetical protein